MNIRHAQPKDLERIQSIYDHARDFMRANGNLTQWGPEDHPNRFARGDIAAGKSYVLEDEGTIQGVFYFDPDADDPTYHVIREGSWPDEGSYGVMHRLAVATPGKGYAGACLDWCAARCRLLRVDTHKDNLPMQKAVEKNGFAYCGIITLASGAPRLAYSRPAQITLTPDKSRRKKILALSLGLYGAGCALMLALCWDILLAFGRGFPIFIPFLLLLALPGALVLIPKLKKEQGITVGREGFSLDMGEPVLRGSYHWKDFSGVLCRRNALSLSIREPEQFRQTLSKRAWRALRQRQTKVTQFPVPLLTLSPADRNRLQFLMNAYLQP